MEPNALFWDGGIQISKPHKVPMVREGTVPSRPSNKTATIGITLITTILVI